MEVLIVEHENLVIRPKNLKGEDGHRVISARLKKEVVEQLDKIAAQTGHSRNELIGMFLDFALEHCVIKGAGE